MTRAKEMKKGNDKFKSVRHEKRKGFTDAYNALGAEYGMIDELLKARIGPH